MKTDFLVAAPELWILVMACVVLMADLFVSKEKRGFIHLLSFLTLIFAALITLRGDYAASGEQVLAFSDTFVRDRMSDVLKLFTFLVLGLVMIYAKHFLRTIDLFKGEFYSLSLFALLGMMVMISANSLITVYLGLELNALATYALVALNRDSLRGSESAMKYFVLGSLASGMLLYGISMIYGATGTLQLDLIAAQIAQTGSDDLLLLFGLAFLVVGLAFKLGVVPFHMWVPDVYEGAPAAMTLFVSSVPKLAAFAMTYRLLEGALGGLHADWMMMLAVLAAASLILGNLVAIMQTNIKRMLAYSTISHMGFVLLGFLPASSEGYGASMFYVITYALTAAGAFAMVILLSQSEREAELIDDYKGLNQTHPWYAAILSMLLFSMAGVPVFVGFFAKWLVIKAVLEANMAWLAVLAVIFSVIGAFYYLRVIKVMYFDSPTDQHKLTAPADYRAALSVNGLLMLGLGIMAAPLIAICMSSFG